MMGNISIYRDEYPGDEAWKRFVEVFADGWAKLADQQRYLAAIPDTGIAAVIATAMGEESLSWFTTPNKALLGRTPSDVLQHERDGVRVIRSLVMRLPL